MGFGFLNMTLIDVIDIFVVALLMFQIYRLTRGTNALRIVAGILIVYLLWIVVRALKMELLSMILGQVIGVGVIALIIVFQQEIRRFLLLLGTQYTNRRHSFMSRIFRPRGRGVNVVGQEWIETVVEASADMARTKTGALIVIARAVNLLPIIEKGEKIDALISGPLIKNIFSRILRCTTERSSLPTDGSLQPSACCRRPSARSRWSSACGTARLSALRRRPMRW